MVRVNVNRLDGIVLCAISSKSSAVLALKKKVEACAGIPVNEQILLHGLQEMRNYDSIPSSLDGIVELSILRRDQTVAAWIDRISTASNWDVKQLLKSAPDQIRANKEVALAACHAAFDQDVLQAASVEVRSDRSFAAFLIERGLGGRLRGCCREVRADSELILAALAAVHRGEVLTHARRLPAPTLWSDREFALAALKLHTGVLPLVHDSLLADRGFVLAAINCDQQLTSETIPLLLEHFSHDFDLLLTVARRNAWVLPHVPAQLRAELHANLAEERQFVRSGEHMLDSCAEKVCAKESFPAVTDAVSEQNRFADCVASPKNLREVRLMRAKHSEQRRLRRAAFKRIRLRTAQLGNGSGIARRRTHGRKESKLDPYCHL